MTLAKFTEQHAGKGLPLKGPKGNVERALQMQLQLTPQSGSGNFACESIHVQTSTFRPANQAPSLLRQGLRQQTLVPQLLGDLHLARSPGPQALVAQESLFHKTGKTSNISWCGITDGGCYTPCLFGGMPQHLRSLFVVLLCNRQITYPTRCEVKCPSKKHRAPPTKPVTCLYVGCLTAWIARTPRKVEGPGTQSRFSS